MDDGCKSWTSDWEAFILAVAKARVEGLDNFEITEKFSGRPVYWSGVVEHLNEEPEHFGVDMRMKHVNVRLHHGKKLPVSFLYLNVLSEHVETWHQVKAGMTVQFSTVISKGNRIFPGIRWSEAGEKELCSTLMIGTHTHLN